MFHLGKKRNFIVQINKNEIKEFTLQNKYPQMLGTIFTCNCSYRQALHTNCIDISSYLIDLNVLGIELFDMYEFVRLYIYENCWTCLFIQFGIYPASILNFEEFELVRFFLYYTLNYNDKMNEIMKKQSNAWRPIS